MRAAVSQQADPPTPLPHRFYRPLEDAADEYIRWAKTPGERVYLGIPAFDEAMRGTAPGELTMIVGYAHSGKTVLSTEAIVSNNERCIAMFTPDETRVLVLVKLASLVHNVSAEDLEQRIAQGDEAAEKLLRATANEYFPNLAVFDDAVDLNRMDACLTEAEDVWGHQCELVVFDFLQLLQGAGEDTSSQARGLKAWGKKRGVPLYVLHQTSRSAGADGRKMTISSGAFGGEQEATHMIGVRRRKNELIARIEEIEEKLATQVNPSPRLDDQLAEARYDLARHQDTITFSLVKNKRPPGRLVDDTDFRLDADTGRIEPLDGPVLSRWSEEAMF